MVKGGVIHYRAPRMRSGTRPTVSTKTDDWEEAAEVRALLEKETGTGRVGFLSVDPPSFAEVARRYLREGTAKLAGTTCEDHGYLLAPEGRIVRTLGAVRIDEISPRMLLDWWALEVEGRGRKVATGRTYLYAIARVFRFAKKQGYIETNPVDAVRPTLLREGTRTKAARAAVEAAESSIRPIETAAEIARLLAAAKGEGADAELVVNLMLDAGLRFGEVQGLRWRDVDVESERKWTKGQRFLRIERSLARGKHDGPPKSGRSRLVNLSRRLRSLLLEMKVLRGSPDPSTRVLPKLDQSNFRHREFRRICERADLGPRNPKDLRDTFASHLVSAGIPLAYVAKQLGHAQISTTETHYARWVGEGYHEPPRMRPGEVPADLLSHLDSEVEVDATARDRA